jgi:diadenylate cyclase
MAIEIQKKIIEKPGNGFVSEDEFISVLKLAAPGTNFRAALDGALKIGNGALIVVENSETHDFFEGGFRINARFTPQRLMELVKMDGGIVLSDNLKRINSANVLLTPSSKVKSAETGTRHKAAERTAKQAGTLVIAISERRNTITLYYKNIKYPLIDTGELLRRANEHIQLLEKQRELFDKYVERLNSSELKKHFDLKQAIHVIQKGKIIQRISDDLKKYAIELGNESALIKIRLKEITSGVEKETDLTIKDYTKINLKKSKNVLDSLSWDEIFIDQNVCNALDYESVNSSGVISGWRLLSKTNLLDAEISMLMKEVNPLKEILKGDEAFFRIVFGDGEVAEALKEQLGKLRENY